MSLPSQQEFTKNMEILTCPICTEPFDEIHLPAKLETCQHILGSTCLHSWMESGQENSNKCPMCRQELFRKSKLPPFVSGPAPVDVQLYPEMWLENIRTADLGRIFVVLLFKELIRVCVVEIGAQIFDSDIDECLVDAARLLREGRENQLPWEMAMQPNHFPAAREVAKKMIVDLYQCMEKSNLTSEQLQDVNFFEIADREYLELMGEVLGWNFNAVNEAEEEDDEDDSDSEMQESESGMSEYEDAEDGEDVDNEAVDAMEVDDDQDDDDSKMEGSETGVSEYDEDGNSEDADNEADSMAVVKDDQDDSDSEMGDSDTIVSEYEEDWDSEDDNEEVESMYY